MGKKNSKIPNLNSATFPEELIKKIIKNFTQKNETILDPFSGTGTTSVVSKKTKRNYIGIEIREKLAKNAKSKVLEMGVKNLYFAFGKA